jgi:hypothetical protein
VNAHRDAVFETVTSYLAARVPGLDRDRAAALLEEVGSGHARSLTQIARYLEEHPDPLGAPGPKPPAALRRVAYRLHCDGHAFVAAPACSRCGKISADLPCLNPDGGGNICANCHARSRRGICAECGKERVLLSRSPKGLICSNCYTRKPERQVECGQCGRIAPIRGRAADGTARCQLCIPKVLRECHDCHRMRPVAAYTGNGAVCISCYRAPARPCGKCGRVRPVTKRADASGPDLCSSCYRGPVATCSKCGQTRPCRYATSDAPLCLACAPIGTDTCHRCGNERAVNARWPIGAVCRNCYRYLRSHPQQCPSCLLTRPLIGHGPDGRTLVCGPCAGVAVDYECRRCGRANSVLNRGRCAACHLADELAALAGEAAGKPNQAQVTALTEALAEADRPVAVFFWLHYSASAATLRGLLGSGTELTHHVLDELLPAKPVHYIREILVAASVLPPRDEHLERIQAWLPGRLATIEPSLTAVIRPYATWFLIHRARRKHPNGNTTPTTAGAIRARINAAIRLLVDLHRDGADIRSLSQPRLDAWLLDNPTRRTPIQPFIAWSNRHRLTDRLSVPGKPHNDPSTFLDETELDRQLERCTSPGPMPLKLRVAGALILVFGLPLGTILRLKRDAVRSRDGNTFLCFDNREIPLPPRIADLVHRLGAEKAQHTIVTGLHRDQPWLFPGRAPHRPATPGSFHNGFARYGITAALGRNTAVRNLASDLPAPILAGATGLHINTATQWSRLARRDAATYLAARIRTTALETTQAEAAID